MRKYIPYFSVVAIIAGVMIAVAVLATPSAHKHTKATSKTSSAGIAETGFQFAAVLNSQPPLTNKIIAEVACQKSSGTYTCIFVGNNSGSIYCVGYNFAVSGTRVREISGRRLSNAYCGL